MPWENWRPAVCMPSDCFCERPRAAWIRQPANAWSNSAAVALGAALLGLALARRARGADARAGLLGSDARHTALLGSLLVLLGAGSFFYHASLTYVGQWVDVVGMYLIVGYLSLYALQRAGLLPGRLRWWLCGVAAASGLFLSFGLAYGRPVFAALVAGLLYAEFRARRAGAIRPARWFIAAFAMFAAAFAIWCLDRYRVVCAPDSLWQGHALWHVMTAASVGALYRYYAGEVAPG